MTKALTAGDPVLFYGRMLELEGVEQKTLPDGSTVTLAVATEPGGTADRDARKADARAKVNELRAQQATATGEEHTQIARRIEAISNALSEGTITLRLRADLLNWWEERGVWVSDGRILSEGQIEEFRSITGRKPAVENQRAALAMLDRAKGA